MTTYPTHNNCLLCNSTQLSVLPKYKQAYLVKCNSCGFVFSHRIPTDEELIQHYTTTYTRSDYLSPITVKRYNELLDKFEKYRKTNRLIDVGSGIGYFLQVAKERGWEVYGTEYTDDAMDICRSKGFIMHQGKLNPANYSPGYFDIITSFEVLEHIYNPQEELKNFHQILRNGGLVYFTTPNFNSFSRRIAEEQWTVIQWPEHLSYYTRNTISHAFSSAGFSKIKMLTTGFSVTRHMIAATGKSEKYIAENNADERLRSQMETNLFLAFVKKVLNTLFTLLGTGDTLKGYFVKN